MTRRERSQARRAAYAPGDVLVVVTEALYVRDSVNYASFVRATRGTMIAVLSVLQEINTGDTSVAVTIECVLHDGFQGTIVAKLETLSRIVENISEVSR